MTTTYTILYTDGSSETHQGIDHTVSERWLTIRKEKETLVMPVYVIKKFAVKYNV